MRKLLAASCLAGIIIAGAAAAPPAYAGGGNPSGTGPPNQTCQNTANSSNQLTTPGKSGSSPGSVFNEGSPYTPGPQGTGGAAYNAAGGAGGRALAGASRHRRPAPRAAQGRRGEDLGASLCRLRQAATHTAAPWRGLVLRGLWSPAGTVRGLR